MARIRLWEGTRVVVGGDEEGQGQARQREGRVCVVVCRETVALAWRSCGEVFGLREEARAGVRE